MARQKTIFCCLDQEHMHIFFTISDKLEVLSELVNPINVTNQTFIMMQRPMTPGWRVSRTSVAIYVYIYATQMDSC